MINDLHTLNEFGTCLIHKFDVKSINVLIKFYYQHDLGSILAVLSYGFSFMLT